MPLLPKRREAGASLLYLYFFISPLNSGALRDDFVSRFPYVAAFFLVCKRTLEAVPFRAAPFPLAPTLC